MDPVIATLTAGVTVLACEVSKGIASAAGSDTWTRIKSLLGFSKEPELAELAPQVANLLAASPELQMQVAELLQQSPQGESAQQIVGSIKVENGKVVIAGQINVSGDFNM
ncbi:MAG: hypothetical protein HQ567_20110 [Candidatus Nealsonbacteria bacterium]|nr:hypothetical protein [Candidatus Nealsonbacteria bacterium]